MTCVLFECLTGRVPHPASTVSSAIRAARFSDAPPRVSTVKAGVPASFDTVIETRTGHSPGTPVRHGRDLPTRAGPRSPVRGRCPRRLRHHLATVPSSTSRHRSAVPRCRGRITRGSITRGPAIPQRFLPGRIRLARRSIQQDRVRVRALRASGRVRLPRAPPLRPVPAVRGIAGTVLAGGAPYGTGPQGTGPYVPAASPYRTGPQGYRPSGGGRDRNMLIPIIGIIAVALVGLLAVGGFLLLSKGSGDGSQEGKPTALVTTTVTPTQDTQVQTTTTDPDRCPIRRSATAMSASGPARPRAAGSRSTPAPRTWPPVQGQARVIVASSPITGDTYRMSCAPAGGTWCVAAETTPSFTFTERMRILHGPGRRAVLVSAAVLMTCGGDDRAAVTACCRRHRRRRHGDRDARQCPGTVADAHVISLGAPDPPGVRPRRCDRRAGQPVGVAIVPVGKSEPVITAGDQTPMVAWSTIKVPLAVASERAGGQSAPQTRAIVESGQPAAESLWASIGSDTDAAAAVTAMVGSSRRHHHHGAECTTARWIHHLRPDDVARPRRPRLPPTFPHGRYRACARAHGAGRRQSTVGVEAMAAPSSTAVKGGWGPGPFSGEVVRQIGLVTHSDGTMTAIAMATQGASLDSGVAAINAVAQQLDTMLRKPPSGTVLTAAGPDRAFSVRAISNLDRRWCRTHTAWCVRAFSLVPAHVR